MSTRQVGTCSPKTVPGPMGVVWDDLNWLEKEGHPMKKSRYSPERVATGPRLAEVTALSSLWA